MVAGYILDSNTTDWYNDCYNCVLLFQFSGYWQGITTSTTRLINDKMYVNNIHDHISVQFIAQFSASSNLFNELMCANGVIEEYFAFDNS